MPPDIKEVVGLWRMTENDAVREYFEHRTHVTRDGYLGFILRGGLSWDSPMRPQLTSADGSLWLRSNSYGLHEPTPPQRNQVRGHLLWRWGIDCNEVWGGLRVSDIPGDAAGAKETLAEAVRRISLICDTASVATGASLAWAPARFVPSGESQWTPPNGQEPVESDWGLEPLQPGQEVRTGVLLTDRDVQERLLPMCESAVGLPHGERGAIAGRAIAWHASGNYHASGLNRFVNYWGAMELISSFLYRALPPEDTGRPSSADRKKHAMALMKSAKQSDLWETVRKCHELLQPTSRTTVRAAINWLFGEEAPEIDPFAKGIQSSLHEGPTSLYQLRNDIAHGNYCGHELDFADLVTRQLQRMRQLSKEVLFCFVNRIEDLP